MSPKTTLLPEFSIVGITVPNLPGSIQITQICQLYHGQVIDFYSMNMEDLAIIAKHRVLPVPTLLVFAGNKVVLRVVKDIPSLAELKQFLKVFQ